MRHVNSLKPQDVAVLVKLLCHSNKEWRQVDLGQELLLPQGGIAKALRRLNMARLVIGKKVVHRFAREFLLHGVPFVFPAEPGSIAYGVPTAISAPMHQRVVLAGGGVEHTYVWPSLSDKMKGQSIEPLYPYLPDAALKDECFYGIMSALDMLRTGRTRERAAGQRYIEEILK